MTNPEEWQRLALWVARPYRWRQDADDIRQEALLGAWAGMQKVAAKGIACTPRQAAVKGAQWAVADYLRKAYRHPAPLRLDLKPESNTPDLESDGFDADEWTPLLDDHAPALIEQIGMAQVIQWALMPSEQQMVERFYWRGERTGEIAAAMGTTHKQMERGLARARKRIKENLNEPA